MTECRRIKPQEVPFTQYPRRERDSETKNAPRRRPNTVANDGRQRPLIGAPQASEFFEPVRTLNVRNSVDAPKGVTALAFGAHGNEILAGRADSTCSLTRLSPRSGWNFVAGPYGDGSGKHRYGGEPVTSLSMTSSGRALAAVSDHRVEVYVRTDKQVTHRLPCRFALHFSTAYGPLQVAWLTINKQPNRVPFLLVAQTRVDDSTELTCHRVSNQGGDHDRERLEGYATSYSTALTALSASPKGGWIAALSTNLLYVDHLIRRERETLLIAGGGDAQALSWSPKPHQLGGSRGDIQHTLAVLSHERLSLFNVRSFGTTTPLYSLPLLDGPAACLAWLDLDHVLVADSAHLHILNVPEETAGVHPLPAAALSISTTAAIARIGMQHQVAVGCADNRVYIFNAKFTAETTAAPRAGDEAHSMNPSA
jgi:hypothetical protein